MIGLHQCVHVECGQVRFYPDRLRDKADVFLAHWVRSPQILPGTEILWKRCLINIESCPYLLCRPRRLLPKNGFGVGQ